MTEPSGRKAAAIAGIIALITLSALFAASLSEYVGNWPVLVQALFYLFVGLAWIAPLKPLLRWAETGKWKAPPERADD